MKRLKNLPKKLVKPSLVQNLSKEIDVSKIEMDFQENQIVEKRFEVDGVLLRERREQKIHNSRSGAKLMRIITRFIGDKKYVYVYFLLEWKQMDNENPQIYSYSKKKSKRRNCQIRRNVGRQIARIFKFFR